MNLRVSYDQDVDILCVSTGQRSRDGTTLDDPAGISVAAQIGTDNGYDIVGFIVQGAAGELWPWFVPIHWDPPAIVRARQLSGYDLATDTLTFGFTTDDPAMITQDNDYLVGYWQPDPEDADYFPLIGVSLLNAAQHLAPFFARAELPAGGEEQG